MKNEIIQRINAVLGALNSIDVRGKANLNNLSGSMAILEEVVSMLNSVEFAEPQQEEAQE